MTPVATVALAAAMFVLAATPGPGVFATVSRALASGFRPAAWLIAGVVLGDLLYLGFALFGLAAVADALGEAFVLVRLAGGAYLVWLGWRIWHAGPGPVIGDPSGSAGPGAHFVSGLFVTLGNPKVVVFYLGFLPTFLDLGGLGLADAVIAAAVVSGVLATVLLLYALAAARARRMLRSPKAVTRLNRSAGGLMMGTGAILVARA